MAIAATLSPVPPLPAAPSHGSATAADAEPDFHELFAAEDRHFWFCARNRLLAGVVRRLTSDLPAGYQFLEVGCGNGNVLRAIERVCTRGIVVGMDLYARGLELARRRTGCALLAGDIHRLPFRKPFEIVGMFDVLEHLPDDRCVLLELRNALTSGGRLVLTVPAHMALWSDVDVYSGHYRRYAPGQLTGLLRDCGFQVEYCTQFMACLAPLMWLRRRAAGHAKTTASRAAVDRQWVMNELKIVPVLNGMLKALLACEQPLIDLGVRLPMGTSLLAIAKRG